MCRCGCLGKRITITVDEDKYKYFQTDIKSPLLRDGVGEMSFSSYVNVCLSSCPLSLSQIVDVAKKMGNHGDNWNESCDKFR